MNDFDQTLAKIKEKIAPLDQLQIERERVRQAAVVVLLRNNSGRAELLIIKRSERAGDPWSGHLALPGGRVEQSDKNLLITAARETEEEVGISLIQSCSDTGSFLGRLSVIAPQHPRLPEIEITPFVAVAPTEISLRLSAEVDRAFWVESGALKRAGASSFHSINFDQNVKKWPAYDSEGGPIWGITERILTDFFSLLD